MKYAILQMAKLPRLGCVKTRMQPALTPRQSQDLHCALIEYCCLNIGHVADTEHQIWLDDSSESAPSKSAQNGDDGSDLARSRITETLADFDLVYKTQGGGDLGERMSHAAQSQLQLFDGIILIGSDCPFIDDQIITAVCKSMTDGCDVVICPAEDGGYVLLAMKEFYPEIFRDMPWSQESLMDATRRVLKNLNLSYVELDTLADIDRPEDLMLLAGLCRNNSEETSAAQNFLQSLA